MTRNSKIRFGFFVIAMLFLTAVTIGCGGSMREAVNELIPKDSGGKIMIDGADFTGLFCIIGGAAMGMIFLVLGGMLLIYQAAAAAIASLIMRFGGIRKTSQVSEKEIKLTKIIIIISAAASVIIGTAVSGFSMVLVMAIFTFPQIILVYLIYFRCLKNHTVTEENSYGF